MGKNEEGFILSRAEVQPRKAISGHPNIAAYRFLSTKSQVFVDPDARLIKPAEQSSLYLMLTLDELAPGGGIQEHYHVDAPVFDHAYYVISGRIRANVGDMERIVGRDSLIYCPSNVRHSITNVGKGVAKVLRLAAAGSGDNQGRVVYTKKQS